jgi:Effector-associated domain 1/GUN4-like
LVLKMELSSQQRKQLSAALVSAFPTKSSLEQMLSYELDRNQAAITGEGSLEDIIFRIIQRAEAEGWIEDLVRAACKTNPGNEKLQVIAQDLLSHPANINLPLNRFSCLKSFSRYIHEPLESPLFKIPVTGELASEVDIDYTGLHDLLQQKKFSEADFETTRLMLRLVKRRIYDTLEGADFFDFPLPDLNTIDKLWLAGSNNRFAFSIQLQVWMNVGGNLKKFDAQTFKSFVRELEWDKDDVPSDKRAKKGHLPKGHYVLTRRNANLNNLRLTYLKDYDEYINKQLEDERRQRKEAEAMVKFLGRGFVFKKGGEKELQGVDPLYFLFLQLARLKDHNT